MRLILVRHGEVEESWLPDLGHNDPPLSARGRRQAEAVVVEIRRTARRGSGVEAVYCSPFRAPSTTAGLIAEGLNLSRPQVSDALMTLTPEILPAGGGLDALAAIQERAWSAVDMLKELHPPEAALVLVSHELTIRALVCRALSVPLNELRRFQIASGSLSTLEFRGERTLLASLNETCHLDALGTS